jgi:hypothetical protein
MSELLDAEFNWPAEDIRYVGSNICAELDMKPKVHANQPQQK